MESNSRRLLSHVGFWIGLIGLILIPIVFIMAPKASPNADLGGIIVGAQTAFFYLSAWGIFIAIAGIVGIICAWIVVASKDIGKSKLFSIFTVVIGTLDILIPATYFYLIFHPQILLHLLYGA